MDREKILRFMEQAKMKIAIVRMNGRFFYCELHEKETDWEKQPYNDLRIVECPAPFEIVG